MSQYYQVCGTVSYGSTIGANAEAVMVQMVCKKNHEISDLLISVCLFESSLNGENITSHIINKLDCFDIDISNWRPAIIDRASAKTLILR